MKKGKGLHPPLEIRIYGDQLLTKEYLDGFKKELLSSIGELVQNASVKSSKKWLKSDEVKKLMNISAGTLQSLRSNGILPYTKIGGLIYYDSGDISKLLDGKKRAFPSGKIAPKKKGTHAVTGVEQPI